MSQDSWSSMPQSVRDRVRIPVLERDGYRCQINGPKCAVVATDVDHIMPRKDGGALLDPGNMRAACEACNRGRRGPKPGGLSANDCTRDHSTVGMPPCPQCGRPGPSREW